MQIGPSGNGSFKGVILLTIDQISDELQRPKNANEGFELTMLTSSATTYSEKQIFLLDARHSSYHSTYEPKHLPTDSFLQQRTSLRLQISSSYFSSTLCQLSFSASSSFIVHIVHAFRASHTPAWHAQSISALEKVSSSTPPTNEPLLLQPRARS